MKNKTQKKVKTKSDKAFERLLIIVGVALLIAFLLGAFVGAGINNAIRRANGDTSSTNGMMTVSAAGKETAETWTDIGEFTCYAYDNCVQCCGKTDGITKSGAVAKANRTVAVDPKVIPLGSIIRINGKEYVAEDIGGSIKGKKIDIFCNSHNEALEFGVQNCRVELKTVE